MSNTPDEKPSLALSRAHMRAQQRGKCYPSSSSALDHFDVRPRDHRARAVGELDLHHTDAAFRGNHLQVRRDRKSTRLNSSHGYISYAVFCLKKKKDDQVYRQNVFELNTLHLY